MRPRPAATQDGGVHEPRASATVLVVDDHASFRAFARTVLLASGYVVIGEAGDGRSAIEAVERDRPDIVLLDVQLPDIDGFEVARRLAGMAEPPAIVLISTRDGSDYGRQVMASGARGFLTKSRLTGAALRALVP